MEGESPQAEPLRKLVLHATAKYVGLGGHCA